MTRDQPNSREKMRDFTVGFVKCVKFHGQFMEGVTPASVTNHTKLSIAK